MIDKSFNVGDRLFFPLTGVKKTIVNYKINSIGAKLFILLSDHTGSKYQYSKNHLLYVGVQHINDKSPEEINLIILKHAEI